MARKTAQIQEDKRRIVDSPKQRVTLPHEVYSVILEDMNDFMPDGTLNGFINHIIARMRKDENVNIVRAIQKRQREYEQEIERLTIKGGDLTIHGRKGDSGDRPIARLARELARRDAGADVVGFRSKWKDAIDEDYEGKRDPIILLTQENILDLQDENGNWDGKDACYKNRKEFIQALLYRYVTRPTVERERIFFHDQYELLSKELRIPCKDRGCLVVTLRHRGENSKNNRPSRCYVVPGALEMDARGLHYYMAGRSVIYGQEDATVQYAPFRLTNIERIEPSDYDLHMSDAQERELREIIRRRGIEFVLDDQKEEDDEDIRIRLTARGYQDYRRRTHNRPHIRRDKNGRQMIELLEDGGVILTLDCPPFQAEIYFITYGAEAEILGPQSLRDRMAEKYRLADALYTE